MAEQLIGDAVLQLRTDGARLDRGIRRGRQQAQDLDRRFRLTSRNIVGSISRIGAAFGVAFGATTVVGLITGTAAALDEVVKAADRVGVTVEALQELRFAAQLAGVDSRTLDTALQRFGRRVAEAAQGTGELRDTLLQYNIEVRDSNGQMRTQEEILGDLANAIKGAESEQERLRISFKAFDSEGAALVEMMRQGEAGLERFRRQARETGSVVSNETARAFVDFNDEITVMIASIRGALVPVLENVLTPALRTLSDLIKGGFGQQGIGETTRAIARLDEHLAKLREQQAGLIGQIPGLSRMNQLEIDAMQERREHLAEQLRLLLRVGEVGKTTIQAAATETDALADSTDEAAASVDKLATGVSDLGDAIESLPPLDETISFGRPGGPGIAEFQAQLERQRRMFGLGEAAPEEQAGVPVDPQELERALTFSEALGQSFADMASPINLANSLATTFVSNIAEGITRALFRAESLQDAFLGVAKSISEAVAQAVIFAAVSRALGAAFGGFGGGGQVTAGTALFGGPGPTLLQAGGTFAARRPFIAGERGPELVMPEVGGRVFSASDTRRVLSGASEGGNTYVFHAAPGMDHAAFAGFKRDIMRELGPGRIEQRAVAAVVNARKRDPRLFGRP
ncbi:MAG: hypothetical protein ACREJ5_04410 [Geminicoccaceae bacterium]